MQEVDLSILRQDIICAETAAGPAGMVVFGASGDLVRRKLLISLFRLFKQDLLSENFFLLGAGRKKLSDEEFREKSRQAIIEKSNVSMPEKIESFITRLYYLSGGYSDISFYNAIKEKIQQLDESYKTGGNIIFYLSVPPPLYDTIVERLGSAGLSCSS